MRTWFCIIVDDQQQAIDSLIDYLVDIDYIKVVATFTDEQEARRYLHVNPIDFIILDVELSKTNAFHFLATLSDPRIPVILYTAFEKYEDKGYERAMIDVLLKPVSRSRFFGALRRMNSELEKLLPPLRDNLDDFYYYFQVKGPTRYGRQIVWFKDIVYIDKQDRKVCMHLVGGKIICSNESFKRVLSILPVRWFKQCCQNIVFNVNFYQGYAGSKVILTELKKRKGPAGDKEDVWEHEMLPVGEKSLYPDFFEFLDNNLL